MDLFLIAHKVRGEAAFDIAEQQLCPMCDGHKDIPPNNDPIECFECDGLGFWWIVSTSGHRAYPYWSEALSKIGYPEQIGDDSILSVPTSMPNDWPDHYPTRSSPKAESSGKLLLAQLGLIPKVVRRL